MPAGTATAIDADQLWLSTAQMAKLLAMHPITLNKLKLRGFFTEGRHWRKLNPLSTRSKLRWHRERTLLRMNAT